MSPLVTRGRAIVGTIALTHLALAIGVVLLALIMGRFDRLPRLGVKLIATATTAHGLWLGSRWAKWLYVFGFVVGTVACLFLAVILRPAPHPLAIAGAVLFGGLAWLLAFAPSVNQFLAYQRATQGREQSERVPDEANEELPVDTGRVCTACGHLATSAKIMFCHECGQRIG